LTLSEQKYFLIGLSSKGLLRTPPKLMPFVNAKIKSFETVGFGLNLNAEMHE